VIGLGVSCSKQLPMERTAMRDAAAEMRAIRDAFLFNVQQRRFIYLCIFYRILKRIAHLKEEKK
jgi:hypothetical protein